MNTKKTRDKIVKFLQDKKKEAGANGFVIGISGGIDSAVTSMLCVEAAEKDDIVHFVNMPIGGYKSIPNEHFEDMDSKYDHELTYSMVDLTEAFDAMLNIDVNRLDLGIDEVENLEDFRSNDKSDETLELAKANLQSRLRMAQLYFIANHENLLVVGTGNKVEDQGVGFFTKYGDGGVDIAPIADLLKSEVTQIGRDFGILDKIVNAEPTDGLWEDNRTDEDQLGLSYEEIENIMMGNIEGIPQSKIDRYNELHKKSRHKMNTPPICEITEEDK